jgi:RIO kinase 1
LTRRTHRRFDDDDYELPDSFEAGDDVAFHDEEDPEIADTTANLRPMQPDDTDDRLVGDATWSTYADASHGPEPLPEWVITSQAATDVDLGVFKTGKEADVSLLRRSHLDHTSLLAVKRYRDAQHRLFHRDSGYLEGRRVRKSREMRAMRTRTAFGRDLIAGQWASAEFAMLARLWSAGAAVPYPVQLLGTELMMEFIGDEDGVAAPRLAQIRPDPAEAHGLFMQMRQVLATLAEAGYAHGDLSPYNVLVHNGRLVLIDLPQVVDIVGNPQGFEFLRRDCMNICDWFNARGAHADPMDLYDELLAIAQGTAG